MSSIAYAKGRWQWIDRKSVKVHALGVEVPKQGRVFVPACLRDRDRKQRGGITSFSAAARKRLRDTLVSSTLPDSFRLGFTLTLPWRDIDWFGEEGAKHLEMFRDCVDVFGKRFRRAFPKSAAIFRVELQQRGAPHLHAVWYLHYSDAAVRGIWNDALADVWSSCGKKDKARRALICHFASDVIREMWLGSVPVLDGDSKGGFYYYGARVDDIANDGAMFRYLADHTSKKKQAQLGYKGKQWGVMGRSNLVNDCPNELSFKLGKKGERARTIILRHLQKVCRYPVQKSGVPFGCAWKRSKRTVGVFYAAGGCVLRLLDLPEVREGLRPLHFAQMLLKV